MTKHLDYYNFPAYLHLLVCEINVSAVERRPLSTSRDGNLLPRSGEHHRALLEVQQLGLSRITTGALNVEHNTARRGSSLQ